MQPKILWSVVFCLVLWTADAQQRPDEWRKRLEETNDPIEKITVLRDIAQSYQQNQQHELALPYLLRAERLLVQYAEPADVLALQHEIGLFFLDWGIPQRAAPYFLRAHQGYEALRQPNLAMRALSKAAHTYTQTGDWTQAISHYQKLEALQKDTQDLAQLLTTQSALADCRRAINQNQVALAHNQTALQTARQLNDPEKIALALNNLAYAQRIEGQLIEARDGFQEAIKHFEKAQVPNDNPGYLTAINNLAILQQNLGDNEAALSLLRKLEERYAKNPVAQAHVLQRIAQVQFYARRYPEALAPVNEAIQIAIEGNQNELLATAYRTKSDILKELGEPRQAIELLELSNKINAQIQQQKNEAERQRVAKAALAQRAESQLELDLVAEEKKILELDKLRSDSIRKANQIQLLRERSINDSLKIAEQQRGREQAQTELNLVRQRLENQRKNQEIADLQQQQTLQALQLQQAEIEQERAKEAKENAEKAQQMSEQQRQLEQVKRREAEQKNYFFIAIGIFFLFGFLLILYFLQKIQRTNSRLKAQNDQILAQKQQIETQNSEINILLADTREKNEQLLASEEELRQNSEELKAINENLEITSHRLEQSLESEIESRQKLTETYEKLKDAQSQLVQSEKMSSLGQLTAGIAHEINNPINFINSGADSVQLNFQDIRELLDKYAALTPENAAETIEEINAFKEEIEFEEIMEETTELIAGLKSGAERTAEIVKGLRTFSRLDESDLKKIRIEEGLDSTLVMLRNQYKDRITIHKDYADTPAIECYAGKLNQVFMNILANAIQAIPEQGEIFLTTQKIDPDHIRIAIRDTGTGMPESVRKRIFEPFFTTKDVGKGTGLGLSITFSIIEKHNGKLEVESEEGKGTTFFITLPVRHPEHT
ncbi:MAG: ATP-binding protein [Bernardetiaceae bacterium]